MMLCLTAWNMTSETTGSTTVANTSTMPGRYISVMQVPTLTARSSGKLEIAAFSPTRLYATIHCNVWIPDATPVRTPPRQSNAGSCRYPPATRTVVPTGNTTPANALTGTLVKNRTRFFTKNATTRRVITMRTALSV